MASLWFRNWWRLCEKSFIYLTGERYLHRKPFMGRYDAICNGLKHHETFSHIAGLSSAIYILEPGVENPNLTFVGSCFGPLEEAVHTNKNPRVIVERLIE